MVSFTKITYAILALTTGFAVACDTCQCQYSDGSHCCVTAYDKAFGSSCDDTCRQTDCGANGASNCISFGTGMGRHKW